MQNMEYGYLQGELALVTFYGKYPMVVELKDHHHTYY